MVIDRQPRMHFAAQLGKRGPHQGAYVASAESAHLPLKQRTRTAEQVEGGPRQAEWLQVVDAAVLKNAKTHGRFSCYAASGKCNYSTVTLLARLRGLSMSQPRSRAPLGVSPQ
jgi:hypothetical protein